MAEFWVKQGDTGEQIQTQLLDASGTAINLTTATGVTFHMKRDQDTVAKVSAAATIINAASGIVGYTWTGTDTDTAGDFKGEWKITYTGGATRTVPTSTYDPVHVMAKLA